MSNSEEGGSILLKKSALYKRYPDLDYPENSEDEIRAVEAAMKKPNPMSALKALAALGAKKEESEKNAGPTIPPTGERYTLGRAVVHVARVYVVHAFCIEHTAIKNKDSSNLDYEHFSDSERFFKKLKEQVKSMKDYMASIISDDAVMKPFWDKFSQCDSFHVAESLETEKRLNAWSNQEELGLVLCVLKHRKESEQWGVYVTPNQARILSTYHCISHIHAYVLNAILPRLSQYSTRDNELLKVWDQVLTNHKTMDVMTWKYASASPVEKTLMDIFTAIFVVGEWMKEK